jgi:hypothetical protein
MKKEQVKVIKNTKVYLSKVAHGRRAVNWIVSMFLISMLFALVMGKDGAMSGVGIVCLAEIIAGLFALLFAFKRTTIIRNNKSIIYHGSFEDLIKEMYIHGFALNKKIGELHVFSTHYLLFKQKMLVKSSGSSYELFGDFPNELIIKNEGN